MSETKAETNPPPPSAPTPPASSPPEPAPEPVRKPRRRISTVWLVPLVALLIGGWLAFRAWSERGPRITISFESAEGLTAGQSKIKYKEVEVGKITAITLSPDFNRVVVRAEIKRHAEGLISEHSRFWVVRPRIGIGGVSGLGTLLSGAYVAVDPGKPGEWSDDFTGLETPPIVTAREQGRSFTLRAQKLGSINVDSPVLFRHLRVGEVTGYELEKSGEAVDIHVFVHGQYAALVHKDSRFWNAGSLDVSIGPNGVHAGADSAVALLLGGVSFESPTSLGSGEPAPEGHVFALYPTHSQIDERVYLNRRYYVVNFNESVRGLSRGAAVEFRGIQVGEVEDIRLEFDAARVEGQVTVLLVIEPERLKLLGKATDEMDDVLAKLVAKGLRAQLRMGSLISGSLFVDLDFYPRAARQGLGVYGAYRTIPATASSMGALLGDISGAMERLRGLPLEEIAQEIRTGLPMVKEVVKDLQRLLQKAAGETVPQASATLEQAQRTLQRVESAVAPGAPMQQDLRRALEDLSSAARSLKSLADTLERRPESVLRGKGNSP
jgi:paraquat-inducible protein B